jgi:hypothetical protein
MFRSFLFVDFGIFGCVENSVRRFFYVNKIILSMKRLMFHSFLLFIGCQFRHVESSGFALLIFLTKRSLTFRLFSLASLKKKKRFN